MIKLIKWGLIFLVIFSGVIKGGKEITPLTFIQLSIIVLAIMYLIKDNANFISYKKGVLDYLIICFLIILFISTSKSIYLYTSIIEVFKIISYILLYYLVFNIINTDNLKNKVLNVVISLGTIIAIVGIYQRLNGRTPTVTFPNENLLAGYLVVGITLALSKLIADVRCPAIEASAGKQISDISKNKFLFSVVCYLLSIVVMFICLIYTHSRGGLLSLFAGIAFLSIVGFKRRGMIFLFSVLLILFVLLPQDNIIKLLKVDHIDPYALKRLSIWDSGIKAIMSKPLLGWGLGTFGYIFYRYNFPVSGAIAQYAKITRFTHNEFIQITVEAGLLALVILILMVFVILKKGIKESQITINNVEYNNNQKWQTIAPVSGMIAILTHSLVDFNLHLPAIVILFIFFSAMIMNSNIIQKSYSEKTYLKNNLSKTAFILGLLILSILVSMPYISYLYSTQGNYKKAALFNPLDSNYHTALGRIYSNKYKDTQKISWQAISLKEYNKAIKLNPEYPYNYEELGTFYYTEVKNTSKAIENYEKAIKKAPYDAKLYFSLGSIYFNEKMFNKAISIYEKAIELEPNYLKAYYYLGRTYEEIGEDKKAFYLYKRVIEILDANLLSKINYTPLDYEKELLSLDNSLVYNRLGLLYMKFGETEKAIDNYKVALEINPGYAEAYSNLGGAYYKMGLYALAANECKKALKIDPKNEMFRENLKKSLEKFEK